MKLFTMKTMSLKTSKHGYFTYNWKTHRPVPDEVFTLDPEQVFKGMEFIGRCWAEDPVDCVNEPRIRYEEKTLLALQVPDNQTLQKPLWKNTWLYLSTYVFDRRLFAHGQTYVRLKSTPFAISWEGFRGKKMSMQATWYTLNWVYAPVLHSAVRENSSHDQKYFMTKNCWI